MGVQKARKVFSLTSTGPGMCSLTCPIKCVNSSTSRGGKARDFGTPVGSVDGHQVEFRLPSYLKSPWTSRARGERTPAHLASNRTSMSIFMVMGCFCPPMFIAIAVSV